MPRLKKGRRVKNTQQFKTPLPIMSAHPAQWLHAPSTKKDTYSWVR